MKLFKWRRDILGQPSEIEQQCYKENKLTFRRVHLVSAIVQMNKLQIKNTAHKKFTYYQQHMQDIKMLNFKQVYEILKGTSYNN